MAICVSYKRLDELEERLGKCDSFICVEEATDLLAVCAELRRCRRVLAGDRPQKKRLELKPLFGSV